MKIRFGAPNKCPLNDLHERNAAVSHGDCSRSRRHAIRSRPMAPRPSIRVIASVTRRCDLWARQMHPGLSWMTQVRFTERLPLVEAWTWLDACPDVTGSEAAPLHGAFGRVLRAPLIFPADRPEHDIALVDGHAVQAESILGASTYNPPFLRIVSKGMAVTAGCASVCHAGETLPLDADAVVPADIGEAVGTSLEVCDAVALGFGIGRKGQAARRDGLAIDAGRRLGVPQIALAASLGVTQLIVRRRPVVTLVLAGPKPPALRRFVWRYPPRWRETAALPDVLTGPPTWRGRSLVSRQLISF